MRAPLMFALAVFATASATSGCSYSPKIKDGELKCSLSGECPDGYECRANACFSRGGKDAGLGGDALPQALLNRYIGDWTLGVTAAVVTKCGNATSTIPLSPADNPSMMTLRAGDPGRNDLISDWLCTLGLRLDNAGAHLYEEDPSCSAVDDEGVTQTWTATSFEVVAPNARTATHTATYNRMDTAANGTVTNCTQTVTAPMTKN